MSRIRGHWRRSVHGRLHKVQPHMRVGGGISWEKGQVRREVAALGVVSVIATTRVLTAVMSVTAALATAIIMVCGTFLGYAAVSSHRKVNKRSRKRSISRLRTEIGWYRTKKKFKTWWSNYSPKQVLLRKKRKMVDKVYKTIFPRRGMKASIRRRPGQRTKIRHKEL